MNETQFNSLVKYVRYKYSLGVPGVYKPKVDY